MDVLANLGDDAIKQVNQHGPALLPFLNNYTDEGLQLINSSDEAAEFVLKHWNDAPEKVALAVDYGKPAMQFLETVDVTDAKKILNALDSADVDVVINFSEEIIKEISDLDANDLSNFSGKLGGISDLGEEAVSQINTYGVDSIPFLLDYKNEGVAFLKDISNVDLSHYLDGNPNNFEILYKATSPWGKSASGINQGIVHFNNYWDVFPDRIPSLAKRLGVDPKEFDNTLNGFENFSNAVNNVIENYDYIKVVGEKTFYFMKGADKAKDGVAVIVYDGKIQTMMTTNVNYFLNKLK